MTGKADVWVDVGRYLGRIDPWIYGQMLEQLGRAVYGGVFDPASPLSDASGFRTDVLETCRQLAPTVLRWPGGNFASAYHWRDGIGPVSERPATRDLAWGVLETNAFGTEEFLELCGRLGAHPYLTVNMGTGTAEEALAWLDYCNSDEPLAAPALRRKGPHPDPHAVRIWGLGNENYGWWQVGQMSAASYAEQAREWGKLLRWTDPAISLVAVGSTDPDWNWRVLSEAGRLIDFLSLHCYWEGSVEDEYHATLAGPANSEADIQAAWGMSLAAARAQRLARPVRIAVDEWGVWRSLRHSDAPVDLTNLVRCGLTHRAGIDTTFEDTYSLADALAVASWLHVLWRNPEKVGLANQAQMVNVIAPIHASPDAVFRHTVFWPLAVARAHAGPFALSTRVVSSVEVPAPGVASGSLTAVDAAATFDPDTGSVHLSVVNRARDDCIEVSMHGVAGPARLIRLWHDDEEAGNDLQVPLRVAPVEEQVSLDRPLVLLPHSHVTLLLQAALGRMHSGTVDGSGNQSSA